MLSQRWPLSHKAWLTDWDGALQMTDLLFMDVACVKSKLALWFHDLGKAALSDLPTAAPWP